MPEARKSPTRDARWLFSAKAAGSDATVSNYGSRIDTVSHLLVSGPTNGFVSNWMKAFEANMIPTSTFS